MVNKGAKKKSGESHVGSEQYDFVDIPVKYHEAHPILDNVDNPVFNKILKLQPGTMIGPGYKRKCFVGLAKKINKTKGSAIKFTKNETELLLDGLNRAIEYEFLFNIFEELNGKFNSARKIIYESGRNETTLKKAADSLGLPTRKGGIDWSSVHLDYVILTQEQPEGPRKIRFNKKEILLPLTKNNAIKVLKDRYKYTSEGALIQGLRKFNPELKLPTHSPT